MFRNIEEFQTRKGLWHWAHLNSARFRSIAATVYGATFLCRGVLNEVFIAMGNDFLWVLSCACLPIASKWMSNKIIIAKLKALGRETPNSDRS